jgi:predicted O-methyltransferase YrrM/MFS family permease
VSDRTTHATTGPGLGSVGAVVIVFSTSAAVLVLEILAGRLLAPYVGVSLETYTGIIGTVLAAIAAGTALGGRLADRVDPRRLLGPTLVIGGVLAWLSLPLLSLVGPGAGDGPVAIVVLTAWSFFLPAAVLSAASPMVAKLRLASLDQTGAVVGGLSAAGTAGALVGTFATGFVLVAALPTRPIVIAVGLALVIGGVGLWWRFAISMPPRSLAAVVLVASIGSLGLAVANPTTCQWETAYFCASIEHDPGRPSGRVLRLDTLRHSYVDLDDPTYLDFRYIRLFAQVADFVDTSPLDTAPLDPSPFDPSPLDTAPLDTLHIGGGGFTFPRYLAATRPGGTNTVVEIDDELIRIAHDHLGLAANGEIEIYPSDARQVVRRLADDTYDLVVGDAFGGLSPPWHLTTREFVEDIRRVLRPGGVYTVNVIDGGPARFARAQVATLLEVFDHVVVVLPVTPTSAPVNHVLVASNAPLEGFSVSGNDGVALAGAAVAGFVDGARSLVDDHAPVDQLITRR